MSAVKGRIGVTGSKPNMKTCRKCGNKFQKMFMGQRVCKDCMEVRKES